MIKLKGMVSTKAFTYATNYWQAWTISSILMAMAHAACYNSYQSECVDHVIDLAYVDVRPIKQIYKGAVAHSVNPRMW